MGEPVEKARIVGRYAIFDEIASGGMATVYLGRLIGSGGFSRTIAIKRLHAQFAKDPEFVTMFLDEARLAARIRHPNVVPTLDVVASKGELFLVMEYVQGESLSRLARAVQARGERIPLSILVRIMNDALQGLHAAHEARDERGAPLEIVHRDVTPQNILVGIDGVGRLLDFGVAKAAGRAHTTREGQLKGKLGYMAPEQLTGSGVTRRTDVYAAAVVLWEMLAGQRLFAGGSEIDVIAKLVKRDIQPPSRFASGIPRALDDLVMRGLAPAVEDRFATARDMCVALGHCGIQESSGMVVGEWVEGLAAEALAQRNAKLVAIETGSDGNPRPNAFNAVQSPKPPAGSDPPATEPLAMPAQAPVPAGRSSEPASALLKATVIPWAGARARRWGSVAALAVLLVALAFAIASRSHAGSPDRPGTAGPGTSTNPTVATVAPPAESPAQPATPMGVSPGGSGVAMNPPPEAPAPAPASSGSTRRAATAAARRAGATAPPVVKQPASVYDSRE